MGYLFIPYTIKRRFPSSQVNNYYTVGYSGMMPVPSGGTKFNNLGNKFIATDSNSHFMAAVGNIGGAGSTEGYHLNLACDDQATANEYFVLGFIGANYSGDSATGAQMNPEPTEGACRFKPQEWEDFNYQTRLPIKVITTTVASAQALLSRSDAEYVSHINGGVHILDIFLSFKKRVTMMITTLLKQRKWGFRYAR